MSFKRIFKDFGRRKKPGNESQGSQLRPDSPSSNANFESRRPGPKSPAAVPFKDTWSNLAAFLDILNHTPAFGPLTAAIDDLSWFIRAHEDVVTTQKEYTTLRIQLEGLFKDLCGYFSGSTPPAMTTSMLNLCEAIQSELNEVYGTQDRGTISRYIQANQDMGRITECYRCIQSHLDRIMMNASLNMWKIMDQQAADARLDRLNPSMSACYDSIEANVVQRRECAPKTREQVLLGLKTWKDNRDAEKVCWMNGMAGTGKTTIATTFCTTLNKTHELGASFFCSRSLPACRDVGLVIPTIAYQLARFSVPFRGALLQVLERDPDVHTKVPRVQFQRMILEPLQEVMRSLPGSITVVIDALDECEDGDGVGQILEVLLEYAPILPIKFLVSSRPERHIRQKIHQSAHRTYLILHELDEKMVQADIETYLREELASITTPPTEAQLSALVSRAGTLFIYAATVVRYIKRGGSANRLAAVLNESSLRQQSSNKNKEIDQLYETVLTSAFGEELEHFEKEQMELVLHTVVCAQEPLTVDALAGLLRLDYAQITDALKPLWSVLHVSESDTSHRVSTLHASFPDYMLDLKRSKQFACNAELHNGKLAGLCFSRIERNQPQFNICQVYSAYMFDRDVPNICDKRKERLPLDLLYAGRYWAAHLESCGWSAERAEMLHEFLSKRLLLWIEILNLAELIDQSIRMMEKACTWLQASPMGNCKSDLSLARDARRFVTMFATSPVSKSTPHLYISMLASWPSNQPVSRHYYRRAGDLVQVKSIETTERQLELLSLVPGGSPIYSVAYSSDGRFFVTGTDEGTIQIWDAVSCRMTIDPIKAHTDAIRGITISPDGFHVCSGSEDKTLCIWDPQKGELIAGPLKHPSWVMSVDYSPDGRWLASGSENGTARIWSTTDWQIKGAPLNGHDGPILSVVFSPNSSMIATGSKLLIHLWNPLNGQMIGTPLSGHTDDINTLAFTPNGEHLISGSDDRTIRVWDVLSGQIAFGPIQEHLSCIDSVAVSPDGRLLVSAARDNTMKIWETKSWQNHAVFHQTGTVRSVRFSPDGSRLLTGSVDENIRVWEVPYAQERQIQHNRSQGHSDWVRSVAFSPCGNYLVSGSDDMTVCIWDVQNRKLTCDPLKGHSDRVHSVGVSSNGNHVVSISRDRTIYVWDRQSGRLADTIGPVETDSDYDAFYQQYWPASFFFDGRRAVYGSRSGRIYMWEDGKLSFELAGHSDAVYSIAFSPDGRSFASGSDNGELILWNASNGEVFHGPYEEHSDCVFAIAFSPDGSLVASGSMDNTIRLWSTHTGSLVGDPLEGHTGGVRSVAFSPSAKQLVSGAQDWTVRVWDIESRTLIAVFKGHAEDVLSVAFSPDGRRIASGSCDMTIRLWDAPASESDVYKTLSSKSQGMTRNNWSMDGDGWVRDIEDRPLLWVPPDLRSVLLWPHNSTILSGQGCIELDFSDASIGDEWTRCFDPFPPRSDV